MNYHHDLGLNDKWTIYKDTAGYWRWSRHAINGQCVGKSHESYVNQSDCEANAKRNGYMGVTWTQGLGADDRWTFYKDNSHLHRWSRYAANNECVGAAHEGYYNSADCVANAYRHGYRGK